MGSILGNRCIVRLHYPIDMDDRSGILGAGIDGIRWQSAGVKMSKLFALAVIVLSFYFGLKMFLISRDPRKDINKKDKQP